MIDYWLLTIIVAAFGAYAVLGGADFGAGIWEINKRFLTSNQDKKLIYRAIGPVWEANHVWLIFGIIAVWTCYPGEFQQLCNTTAFLLAVALVGIVLRGASYAFRSSGQPGRAGWEILFACSSTLTPFCFGCITGVLSLGEFQTQDWSKANNLAPAQLSSPQDSLTNWLNFPSVFFGFFAVGICSFIASIFLAREAASSDDRNLRDRWHRHAVTMSWMVGGMSIGGLLITATFFDQVWNGIMKAGLPLVAVGIASGIATILSLRGRRYWLSSIFSSCAVIFVMLAWVVGQLQSGHQFGLHRGAVETPDNVKQVLLICMLGGLLVIIPPIGWLFWLFKSSQENPERNSAKS